MSSYAPAITPFDTNLTAVSGSPPRHALVFVHGILSSHVTFLKAYKYFRRVSKNLGTELAYFDYDYRLGLVENGRALGTALKSRYGHGETTVSLVCHSMGGLIGRLSILANDSPMPFLRALFMLGTPNRGAFHSRQLDPLFAAMLESGIPARAVQRRARGILELTDAYSILNGFESKSKFANDIFYISIPGCFFHERRAIYKRNEVPEKLFWLVNLTAALSERLPIISVRLNRPHDGVVERVSNSLIPCDSGQWSEKASSVNFRGNPDPTYVHVQHRVCDELTHGRIQSSYPLLRIMWEMMLAGSISGWIDELTPDDFGKLFYWTENAS
ncbi:hypothetical protein AWB71_02883 [Caballeronia peredens]|nr:hypothetical protein AWB71_02883 [Caballeronia peredens]